MLIQSQMCCLSPEIYVAVVYLVVILDKIFIVPQLKTLLVIFKNIISFEFSTAKES